MPDSIRGELAGLTLALCNIPSETGHDAGSPRGSQAYEIRDGRADGCGASDMKAGLAVMLPCWTAIPLLERLRDFGLHEVRFGDLSFHEVIVPTRRPR